MCFIDAFLLNVQFFLLQHGDDDYSLLVNLKKLDDDPQFSRKISIEKLKKLPHGKLRSSGKRW